MLVKKIAPKIRPYVLASLLCVGISPLYAREQYNDSFLKRAESAKETTQIQRDDTDGNVNYLFKLIKWIPLFGLLSVIKLADYVEKKENKEDKETAGNN